MSGKQCPHELSSLSTTGRAATFTGLLGCLESFGIVAAEATLAPGDRPEDWVRLGKGSHKIVTTPDVAGRFIEVFDWEIDTISTAEDLAEVSRSLEKLRGQARDRVPEMKFGGTYVWPHVVRKLVMGAVTAAPAQGRAKLDWFTVQKALLLSIVPDEDEHLKQFPDFWTVGEIGDLVFGSPEQGFYASCWGCLFHEPIKAWPRLVDDMQALFKENDRFEKGFEAVHGSIAAPTPMKLLKALSPFSGVKQAKKVQTDSASRDAQAGPPDKTKAYAFNVSRCFSAGQSAAKATAKPQAKKAGGVKKKAKKKTAKA